MSNKLRKKNAVMKDGNELPPDEIVPFLDNPFLDTFHGHTIVYHKEFYVAMYKKIHEEGMTYVEAYNALGFDTKILGENRANSAGKRVMQMARENKLFTVDPSNYDGSVPREEMGNLAPEEEIAYLKARNMYLEELVEAQKKNPVVIGGNVYIFEVRDLNVDVFQMADNVIRRQEEKEHPLPVERCLKIFGVSKSGYYAWRKRREQKAREAEERKKELREIKEKFRKIVKKLGFVPGKRTFRTHMFREYGFVISVKRCARIMKMMNLVANRPKKDAYKGQATHDHRCAAPENKVKQEFYIGPRKVVLTDITYFYYGRYRSALYLCAFRDAYTREILGSAAGTRMTTDLVKEAYDEMMEKHRKELKKSECYIHSDQGSQYLSTTFKEILSDDGFIQSVSRRGNSQDNAPMESFFGQMKCRIIDLVALCPDAETAIRMIKGYIHDYNTKIYQHSLAGLTPEEYYIYVTQGIYPCDSYFGVKATEMMPIGDLVAARLEEARKKEEKVRERNRERREAAEEFVSSPSLIVSRDQARLRREKSKWKKSKDLAEKQIAHIEEIIAKTVVALKFLVSATEEILTELKYPQNWKKYKELDYVFEMNELF